MKLRKIIVGVKRRFFRYVQTSIILCSRPFPLLKKILWKIFQQTSELKHHKGEGGEFRSSNDFDKQSDRFFKALGYDKAEFSQKWIIDVGAGSRLRTHFFNEARIAAIEPLASKFRKLPQCDFDKAEKVFACSAEQFIPELKNIANLIVCINVLDHVYNPTQVIRNCSSYLKQDGEFILQTDYHPVTSDLTHPCEFTKAKLVEIFRANGFEIVHEYEGSYITANPNETTIKFRKIR